MLKHIAIAMLLSAALASLAPAPASAEITKRDCDYAH